MDVFAGKSKGCLKYLSQWKKVQSLVHQVWGVIIVSNLDSCKVKTLYTFLSKKTKKEKDEIFFGLRISEALLGPKLTKKYWIFNRWKFYLK